MDEGEELVRAVAEEEDVNVPEAVLHELGEAVLVMVGVSVEDTLTERVYVYVVLRVAEEEVVKVTVAVGDREDDTLTDKDTVRVGVKDAVDVNDERREAEVVDVTEGDMVKERVAEEDRDLRVGVVVSVAVTLAL